MTQGGQKGKDRHVAEVGLKSATINMLETSMTVPGVWHENGFVIYMVAVYDIKNQAILQDTAYQSKWWPLFFFSIVFYDSFPSSFPKYK